MITHSDYKIVIYKQDGTRQQELWAHKSLYLTRQRNAPGGGQFTVRANHPAVQNLEDDGIIEIWRRNQSLGLDWYKEFTALYTGQRQEFAGYNLLTVYFTGIISLLERRIVSYYSGLTNLTAFSAQPAETIAKRLVEYNAAASATVANGRMRTPNSLGITVQPTGGLGNSLTYNCAWDNLLEAVQKISGSKGGGDFDLERTGTTGRAFVFNWYNGQLGTDRTATLTFSLERTNMRDPLYTRNWRERRTAAIVGGQGEGSSRAVQVRTVTGITSVNDAETFVDARDVDTAAGLQSRGDKKLQDLIERETIDFDFEQSLGCAYGVNYFLGDRVAWSYGGANGTILIDSVSIESAVGNEEKISVGLKYED